MIGIRHSSFVISRTSPPFPLLPPVQNILFFASFRAFRGSNERRSRAINCCAAANKALVGGVKRRRSPCAPSAFRESDFCHQNPIAGRKTPEFCRHPCGRTPRTAVDFVATRRTTPSFAPKNRFPLFATILPPESGSTDFRPVVRGLRAKVIAAECRCGASRRR
jgi:hypothetical protein